MATLKLDSETAELYMKMHRKAFEASHVQRILVEADRAIKICSYNAQKRRDSRYRAMLLEHYGGTKCIKRFIMTAEFEDFKVPASRQRASGVSLEARVLADKGLVEASQELPQNQKPPHTNMFGGRRYTPAKRQARKARYLGRLVADIEDPTTESARARRTSFMTAVRDPALLEELRRRYTAARATAEAWR